jgi:hypothetical protein
MYQLRARRKQNFLQNDPEKNETAKRQPASNPRGRLETLPNL